MSSSIDQRIVEMKFDNAQFEKGVAETIKSLDSLDKSLGTIDSSPLSEGVSNLEQSASGLDGVAAKISEGRSKISEAFDILSSTVGKFTLIGAGITAGFAAIQSAFNFQGGWNRALNLENAKFQLQGLGVEWENISESISTAVDGTAYGLDAAAMAASQFKASGVELGDEMTRALGGISGAAAMTNSSYEEIANVFTRVAGQGRVMATDLNSLAARGLNAAAIMADAWGTTEEEVRAMVSAGEVGFNEFADIMYEKFFPLAQKANDTFNGALSNMNAAWSRFWAQFLVPAEEGGAGVLDMLRRIFLAIRQGVNTLTKMFAPIMEALSPITEGIASLFESISGAFADAMTDTIDGTTELTSFGREFSADVKYIGDAIWSFLRPIKAFFDALLPSFEELYDFIYNFRDVNFFDRLGLSESMVEMLESAMTALGTAIKNLFGPILWLANHLLNDVLIMAFIVAKDAIFTFFDAVWSFAQRGGEAFNNAISQIKNPLDALAEAFSNSSLMTGALGDHIRKTGQLFGELWDIMNGAGSLNYRMPWDEIGAKLGEIGDHLFGFLKISGRSDFADNLQNNYIKPLGNLFGGIWNLITQEGGAELVFSGIGSVFANIANGFTSFVGLIGGILADLAGVVLDGLGYVLEIVSGIGSGIIDFFGTVLSNIGVLGESFVSGIVDGLSSNEMDSAASGFEESAYKVGDAAGGLADRLAKSPIGELVDGIGKAFGDFGAAAKDHAPTVKDWGDLFGGLNSAIGKFVEWLDPIGRMQAAIEGIKKAFEGFGTDSFEGWGTKFLGQDHPLFNFLNTLSESLSGVWKTIKEHLPSGEEVAAAIGSLADGVVEIINTLAPLFEGIGRIIGTIGSDAIEFFAHLGEKISNFGGFDLSGIGEFFKNTFEAFNQFTKDFAAGDVNIFDAISGFFENIFNFFQTIGEMLFGGSENLDTASEVVQDTSEFCDNLSGQIEPIGKAADIANQAGEKLVQIGSDLQNGTGFLGQALLWVKDNMLTIAGVLAGGAMFLSVYKAVKGFVAVEKSLVGALDGIKGLSEALINKINPPKPGILTQIRNFILALAALAATFIIITLIPKDTMWESLAIIGILAAIIVGIILAMALINKKLGSMSVGEAYGMAATIGAIGAAVLLMSLSLGLIALIPPDRAGIAAGIIAGMMTAIYFIIQAISKGINAKTGTQLLAASFGIVLLGLALLEFAGIIALFNIIPWGSMQTGIFAVIGMLTLLTTVGIILGRNSANMNKAAAAIMAMGASLLLLTASILLLEAFRNESTDYLGDIIALLVGLAGMVAAILVLDKFGSAYAVLERIVKVVQMMGVVMLEIAAAILIVELFSSNATEMLTAMASLILVLAAMVGALLILDKFSSISGSAVVLLEIAGALIIVSAAMILVSSAISRILETKSTWDQMIAAAASMSIAFAAMAGILALMSSLAEFNVVGILVAAAALVVVSFSMVNLANALSSMKNVSWDNVWQLIAFLTALTIAGAIAGATIVVAAGILAIGGAMLMIGTAVLNAGEGIKKFSEGISILSRAMVPFVEALDIAMGKFAETMQVRFPQLIDTFISNFQTLASKMPELISSIAQVVSSVITGVMHGLAESVPQVADSLLTMMESAIQWMEQNSERLQDDIIGFANVLGTLLGDAILGLLTLITSALGTILDGIGNMIADAAENFGAESAKKRADAYVDAYASELEQKGTDAVLKALEAIDKNTISDKVATQTQIAASTGGQYFDTPELQEYIAQIEYLLSDQEYMDSLMQSQRDHIIELADATGNHAVMRMADLYRTTQDVNNSLGDLQLTQDDFIKDSDGVMIPYQTLADNLQPIADKLFPDMNVSVDDLLASISDLGEGSLLDGLSSSMTDVTGLLSTMVDNGIITQEQLDSLNLDSFSGAFDGIFTDIDSLKFDLEETAGVAEVSGEAFATALANGVDVSGMVSALGEVKTNLDETYESFNKVHVSGSADMNALAAEVSLELSRIQTDLSNTAAAAGELSTAISNALTNSSAGSDAYNVGYNICVGLKNGINDYAYIAENAARELGRKTAEEVKAGAGEASPSKITIEAGKFMALGIGIGIRQNRDFALDAAEDLGRTAANAMRISLATASEMLDVIDWDAQPVIRPVLDTSDVESGMLLLNSMLGSTPAIQAAYAAPGSGRIFTGGSSKIYQISVDLNYQAGDDANDLARGLVSKLEDYASLEG